MSSKLYFLSLAQDGRCAYCQKLFGNDLIATKDHVVPRSKDGKNGYGNILAACFPCNSKKDNRMPTEDELDLVERITLIACALSDLAESQKLMSIRAKRKPKGPAVTPKQPMTPERIEAHRIREEKRNLRRDEYFRTGSFATLKDIST